MNEKLPVYGISEFSSTHEEGYFYSNELRDHLESHKFINVPHKHSTYISILFTKGSGEHQIDFNTFPVKPGSVFLINPGQVHCWKLSEDVEGFVFFHTKEFYDSIYVNRKIEDYPFFYLQQNYPVIYLSSNKTKAIEQLFNQINEEFMGKLPSRMAALGTLVDLLYIHLTRLYQNKEEKNKDRNSTYLKVKKLQKLIDEHFKTKKFPSEYADLMFMSTRHLSRLCQETLNKTTSDLISDRIITEAKRMLIHKDISVSMVAEELGYEDDSYFIRMFKKKTSRSPKEFQTKMKMPF